MPNEQHREYGRFLTDRHREYLHGERDENDSSERQLRLEIRNRTVGALLDLGLVGTRLTRDDRKQIHSYAASDPSEHAEHAGEYIQTHELEDARYGVWGDLGVGLYFQYITQFLYKLVREGRSMDYTLARLEQIIEKAEHEHRNGFEFGEGSQKGRRAVDVEAEFQMRTVDDVDLDRARERFERGTELSGIEMKALVESGDAKIELNE